MKHTLLSPDAEHRYDPPSWDTIRQMEGRVDSIKEADVVGIPITHRNDFKFRESLGDEIGDKPWVLYDWSEFGWDWTQEDSYLWGYRRMEHPAFRQSKEYRKFDDFVREHPPIMTFQRELLAKDVTDRLQPIEYLNWLRNDHGNDTEEEFKKRPLEVAFNFGRSSETRMWLHGEIFKSAGRFGYDVISEFSHIDKALEDNKTSFKWLSVHVPHYARIDVHDVQKINRKAKVGIILNGAGVKTFRTGETCADFIMAMPKDKLAWAYPWDHSNSIVLPQLTEMSAHEAAEKVRNELMRVDLYQLYGEAMANAQRYEYATYLRRHVSNQIQKFL